MLPEVERLNRCLKRELPTFGESKGLQLDEMGQYLAAMDALRWMLQHDHIGSIGGILQTAAYWTLEGGIPANRSYFGLFVRIAEQRGYRA